MSTVWGEIMDGGRALKVYSRHAETLAQFHPGERLRITVDRDRNGKFNALVHVMISKLVAAINRGPAKTSTRDLKKWVKLKKGWYDVVPLPTPVDGQSYAIDYRSTAFHEMAEGEFHQFAMDLCEMVRAELAPWVKDAPEWVEIIAIVGSILPEGAA